MDFTWEISYGGILGESICFALSRSISLSCSVSVFQSNVCSIGCCCCCCCCRRRRRRSVHIHIHVFALTSAINTFELKAFYFRKIEWIIWKCEKFKFKMSKRINYYLWNSLFEIRNFVILFRSFFLKTHVYCLPFFQI